MARLIVGSCSGSLALSHMRTVLSELSSQWPDIYFTQRTLAQNTKSDQADELFKALEKEQIHIALFDLTNLPTPLDSDFTLVSVVKRLEPRSALISKGQNLAELEKETEVGVFNHRDACFVKAARHDLIPKQLDVHIEEVLSLLSSGDLQAAIVPCAHLVHSGHKQQASNLLDVDLFPPQVGQGCIGLVVKADNEHAFELAYTLQHRPSYARISAERSFAQALSEHGDYVAGALATNLPDGELHLFGAITDQKTQLSVQAEISGESSEAKALGKDLAEGVLEQMNVHTS